MPVEDAIENVKNSLGYSIQPRAVAQIVSLTDFVFQKIEFPENKAKKVRALKNKLRAPRRRYRPSEWIHKRRSQINEMLELLKYPIRDESERTTQVGPFTLKNPIMLEDHKVELLEEICTKALKLCTNSLAPNFTQALYGDVVLVEMMERANWYAWYSGAKDEITMKYMDREKKLFIKTFIHEIGHRYYQKILPNEKKRLWATYDRRCHRAQRIDLNDWIGRDISLYLKKKRKRTSISSDPKSGDPVTIAQIGTPWSPDGVYVKAQDGTEVGPFRSKYLKTHIKAITGIFPTQYATSDVEEHFCEALAYKAVGLLHPKSLEAFNSIIVDGRDYQPDGSNFTSKFEPSDTTPETEEPETTQVEETLPSKQEMVRTCESLASRLALSFKKGRKYGLFIYLNEAVGSTHAYMFIDYSTGNLFVPKNKSKPNLNVNIANIQDESLDVLAGFERMSNLRPRWRTMNAITEPTKVAPPTEIIDQTPEPTIPTSPEGNLEAINEGVMSLAAALGMTGKRGRKYFVVIYDNLEQGSKHTYLLIDKNNGNIYPPKHTSTPIMTVLLGNVFEPNIVSKVNTEVMDRLKPNWRVRFKRS